MYDLLTALALVLVIEGLALALMPGHVRTMALRLQEIPPSALRNIGLLAAVVGVLMVWLVRA